MARPTKPPHELRKPHGVRYTDAEWDSLCAEGARAGMTASEFVRQTSLGARVTLAFGPKPADPRLIAELNRLSMQLSGLGNLANQVALYAHTERAIPGAWASLPDEIRRAQRHASGVLEEVVKSHAG